MRPYSPAVSRYIWTVIGSGCALMLLCFRDSSGAGLRWLPFCLLTALGAVAHLYPVRSAQQRTRYVVANAFIFAAVVLLDPRLLALHCAAILLPYTLRNHRRPRIWYGYAFNSAQMGVAAFLAHGLISVAHGPQFTTASGLVVITLAAAVYTLVQALLVAVVIALNNAVPLRQTDALAPRALLAEAVQPFMGVVVAALWLSAPWVLAVLPIPVLVMYMLVRQVHVVQSADIDAKTGLYNYKYFLQALSEELNRSAWVKRPLSVLFADMDYLRNVNNQWGHLAGDEVLKQLAEIIRRQVRPGDVVARFGGEEFVVMLPGTDIEEALHMAEQVRAAVADWTFAIGGGRSIHCTISIGAACSTLHGTDGNALVEAADGALYLAKAAGRNRVVRAQAGQALGPPCEVAAAAAVPVSEGPPAVPVPDGPPAGAVCEAAAAKGNSLLQRHRWWAGRLGWVPVPAAIVVAATGAYLGTVFQVAGWASPLLFMAPVLMIPCLLSVHAARARTAIAALEKAKAAVEAANRAQQRTVNELIDTVAAIIDARDHSTSGHSRQVARYAVAIAAELELDEAAIETIRIAALLHDLGKVAISEAILAKPARLTDEEYGIIKQHAAVGERILSEVSALGVVARIVGEHHEQVNGSGYPRGKAGEGISLGGRIIAVADALDSMLSDRPYAAGRPLDDALAELVRCAGQHFDTRVVTAVHQVVARLGPGAFVNSAHAATETDRPGEIAV